MASLAGAGRQMSRQFDRATGTTRSERRDRVRELESRRNDPDRDSTSSNTLRAVQAGLTMVGGPLGAAAALGLELASNFDGNAKPGTPPTERVGRRNPRDDDERRRLRAVTPPPASDEDEEVDGTVDTDIAGVRGRRRRVLGDDTRIQGSAVRRRRVLGL